MKKPTLKEQVESKNNLIDYQEKKLKIYEENQNAILKGWGDTLREWKRWTNIGLLNTLLAYVGGIILGIIIGGALL